MQFDLTEISFEKFDEFIRELKIPYKNKDRPTKYFQINNHVQYPNLRELIEKVSISEYFRGVHAFDRGAGESRILMEQDRDAFFRQLIEKERESYLLFQWHLGQEIIRMIIS